MTQTTLGALITGHWSGYSFRSQDYIETGIAVLTKGDIKPRGVVQHGGRFVDEILVADKRIKLTAPNDLLVTTRDLTTAADFLGLVSRAPKDGRFAVNQGVTVFRVDESKVDRRYLTYWCESPAYRGIHQRPPHGGNSNSYSSYRFDECSGNASRQSSSSPHSLRPVRLR